MGEKYYKPILKDGDHLVRSSKNPSRVRGQSRDADNKNPDIVEWEEVEIEDNTSDYEPISYEERQVQLSPEEERIAQAIGEALGAAIVAGAVWLIDNKVTPWWKRTAWPWIKEKGNDAIGKLMHDFNSLTSEDMNYKELAEGIHHFKENEEGRYIMCESVKNYAKEYAEEYNTEDKIVTVKNLMKNMKWTLEQTLNNMGVSDRERSIITQQLQK